MVKCRGQDAMDVDAVEDVSCKLWNHGKRFRQANAPQFLSPSKARARHVAVTSSNISKSRLCSLLTSPQDPQDPDP